MKILLIRPPRIKQAITLSDFMYSEPLGLEMLVSLLKDKHDVEIFDMMCDSQPLFDKLKDFRPEVIGITSLCIDVLEVLSLAEQIKAFNSDMVTVVGGTQAFLNPRAFYSDLVDYIFKFTTAENVKGFFTEIEEIRKGISIPGVLSRLHGYEGEEICGRNEYILPDRKATEKYRHYYSYFGYKPSAIMQISKGCRKACRFCLRWRIEGCEEQELDEADIERDILNISEPTVMLYDNDIFGSAVRVERFINILKRNNIDKNFIAYASVEGILANRQALESFKKHGLKALLVGYESFSDEEMSYYTKKARVEDNIKASELLYELGIDVWASFMAHPDWDKEDFKAFRRFVKKLSPQISSVSPLTPFPGLPLYEEYEDRLLYSVEDYEKWSFGQVMISPGKMTLKAYYREMLLTNLYINIILNKPTEMLQRYGIKNIIRLARGSFFAMIKYIKLMKSIK